MPYDRARHQVHQRFSQPELPVVLELSNWQREMNFPFMLPLISWIKNHHLPNSPSEQLAHAFTGEARILIREDKYLSGKL